MKLFALIGALSMVNSMNVLHITDVHYDHRYRTGAPATCLLESTGLGCCRYTSIPKPLMGFRKAGVFGDYNCDTSIILFKKYLQSLQVWITENPGDKPDLVLWTGDNASHEDHLQTPHINREATRVIGEVLNEYFPDIPIIGSLGNHDVYPVNTLSNKRFLNKWLLDKLSDYWTPLLRLDENDPQKPEIMETLKTGGYYSFSPKAGLRIISLNALAFSTNNIFLSDWQKKDPMQHRTWLEGEFEKARLNKEKIWIASHFSKDFGDSSKSFNEWFQGVLDKNSDLIAGNFGGHSHRDESSILRFSLSESMPLHWRGRPAIMYYVTPSFVPAQHHPISRIFRIDDESFEVKDYTNIAGDMDFMNGNPDTEIMPLFKLYDFRQFTSAALTRVATCTDPSNRSTCAYKLLPFKDVFHALIHQVGAEQELPLHQLELARKGVLTAAEFELFSLAMILPENEELLAQYLRIRKADPKEVPNPSFPRKNLIVFPNNNENTRQNFSTKEDFVGATCDKQCKHEFISQHLSLDQLMFYTTTPSLLPQDPITAVYNSYLSKHDLGLAPADHAVEHARELSRILFSSSVEELSDVSKIDMNISNNEEADSLLQIWASSQELKRQEQRQAIKEEIKKYINEHMVIYLTEQQVETITRI